MYGVGLLHDADRLQFPNVNYPPSVDDPPGFSIRYIWCAYADGPAGQINTMSKKRITPYRPIIAAPPGTYSCIR